VKDAARPKRLRTEFPRLPDEHTRRFAAPPGERVGGAGLFDPMLPKGGGEAMAVRGAKHQ
jgi:hypothetical protein